MIALSLREARARYAAAPSHVPATSGPAVGTYCLVSSVSSSPDQWAVLQSLRVASGGTMSLVEFNASHTTEEVLAVFDRAIEDCS